MGIQEQSSVVLGSIHKVQSSTSNYSASLNGKLLHPFCEETEEQLMLLDVTVSD